MLLRRLTPVALALALSAPSPIAAQSPGEVILGNMEAAYRGKWYNTLTFIQKTTFVQPGSPDREQLWWESVRYTPQHGVQLRIDMGDLSLGNGVLYTTDSSWRVQNGAVVRATAQGNEFLPLIEGVYVQPLDVTVRQIAALGIDMNTAGKRTVNGRSIVMLGNDNPADTTRSQIWVDEERQVVTRMVLKRPSGPALDVLIDGYVRAGGGWLGTKVDIFIDGVLRQREVYTDWKVDVPLPADLFDVSKWKTAPHWGRK